MTNRIPPESPGWPPSSPGRPPLDAEAAQLSRLADPDPGAQLDHLSRALEEGEAFNIRQQLLKLKRRRWMILSIILAVTASAALLTQVLTPRFTASADILIEVPRPSLIGYDPASANMPPELEAIQPEVAIIQSRRLAERVVRRLELEREPEFMSAAPFTFEIGDGPLAPVFAWLNERLREEDTDGRTEEEARMSRTVDRFLDGLRVTPIGRSRVISIAYTSVDPGRAAMIANQVAEEYLRDKVEGKYEASERTARWLQEWLETLRAKTETSEKEVAAYRERTDIVQGERTSLALQEISQFSTELIRARAKRAEVEARLRRAEVALAGGAPITVVEEVSSPLIQNLGEQFGQLQREEARLLQVYGPKHPNIASMRAEIGGLQSRIRAEVAKIVGGLRSEAEVARMQEESLARELDGLKAKVALMGQAEASLKSLVSEAEANRQLFNSLQARSNEIVIQQDAPQSNARVISAATMPDVPSFPNRRVFLILAVFFSSILGIAAALMAEHLKDDFRSIEDLTRRTGLPAFGVIPLLRSRREGGRPQDMVLARPRSAFADAIGSAATSLLLAMSAGGLSRTVLVTSTRSHEGKSTFALNLARMLSQMGKKTLLVDADLRAPSVHRMLGAGRSVGLSEILAGKVRFEEALIFDGGSDLDLLFAGEASVNPMLLLSNLRARLLFRALAERYDVVIIDGPPVMAVTDARVMAGFADRTLFVVRWGYATRGQVLLSLKQLVEAGASLTGLVMSMVDLKRHADYGFADSGKYLLERKYYQG